MKEQTHIKGTENETFQTDYILGNKLERGRIKKKWSVQDVSKNIYISSVFIEAIEKGDINALPETAYVIGFIRSYASLLDINSDPLIEEYKKIILKNKAPTTPSDLNSLSDAYNSLSDAYNSENKKKWIIILAGILLISSIIWVATKTLIGNNTFDDVNTSKNKFSEETEPVTVKMDPVAVKPIKVEPVKITPTISIGALKNVEINIQTTSGKVYFKGILKAKQAITVPFTGKYTISSNNGGTTFVSVSGIYNRKVLGKKGIVLSAVKLSKPELIKYFK